MDDYKFISDYICYIIKKNKDIKNDFMYEYKDTDAYIFVADIYFMDKSLSILYNKVDSGEIEETEKLIYYIDAIIMDYEKIISNFSYYENIVNGIEDLIKILITLKNNL